LAAASSPKEDAMSRHTILICAAIFAAVCAAPPARAQILGQTFNFQKMELPAPPQPTAGNDPKQIGFAIHNRPAVRDDLVAPAGRKQMGTVPALLHAQPDGGAA
jgi:hypothetical protein